MDFINKFANQASGKQEGQPQAQQQGLQQEQQYGQQAGQQAGQQSSSGGFLDKLHGIAGGGPESEKKEDTLDKGIDWVQENVLKQGPQTNENAAEQAKDKMIAQAIRGQYQTATGKEFPVKEKQQQQETKSSGGFGGLF